MKRCPECRRDYTDETLNFCLDDGAALLDGPTSKNEPATAILNTAGDIGDAQTRAQIHTTEKTAVRSSTSAEIPGRRFDKLLLIAPMFLVLVAMTGFFGYR